METRISGSGKISAGEYDNIGISGSCRMEGPIRCSQFRCSGSAHGDQTLECSGELSVSGSCHFEKGIQAQNIRVSGALHCGGNLTVSEEIRCSGKLDIGGDVKCSGLSVSGGIHISDGIESERVIVSGFLNCGGLLNAEDIEIRYNAGMTIGGIGGSSIKILRDEKAVKAKRMPLLSLLAHGCGGGTVTVKTNIEGDIIALEGVKTPRVTGRVVAIGADCEIDVVQYSEQIEVSPDAKVGRTEKI